MFEASAAGRERGVHGRGGPGLRALVRANGRFPTIGFGSPAEFEAAWAAWVRGRYF